MNTVAALSVAVLKVLSTKRNLHSLVLPSIPNARAGVQATDARNCVGRPIGCVTSWRGEQKEVVSGAADTHYSKQHKR